MTVFLYTFTEREKVYNLCEQLTGARFTTSYTRVGGQFRDMPPGFEQSVRKFLTECEVTIGEISKLLDKNKIFLDRMVDVGVITRESAIAWGITGPNLRASGVRARPPQGQPVPRLRELSVRRADRRGRRLLRPLSDPHGGDAPVDPHLPPGARHHARRPGQHRRTPKACCPPRSA